MEFGHAVGFQASSFGVGDSQPWSLKRGCLRACVLPCAVTLFAPITALEGCVSDVPE